MLYKYKIQFKENYSRTMVQILVILIVVIIQMIHILSLKNQNMYLSTDRWMVVNNILSSSSTTKIMKDKIKEVIFNCYEGWSIKHAREFKMLHQYKCRNIGQEELNMYALKGLIQSIRNYNPEKYYTSFDRYSYCYIMGELYRGMTELQPLTMVPKKERRNRFWATKHRKFMATMGPIMYGESDIHVKNGYNTEKRKELEDISEKKEIWNKARELLDANSFRTFQYKYDYDFHVTMSNKKIAGLMECSEETVRKNLLKSKQTIRELLNEMSPFENNI